MLPFEPAWFSTMTGCPSSSESFCPTTRAAMSGAPPGGMGTMSLIGRDGCADAKPVPSATRHRTNKRKRVLITAVARFAHFFAYHGAPQRYYLEVHGDSDCTGRGTRGEAR